MLPCQLCGYIFFQEKNIKPLIARDMVFIAVLYCIGTLSLNISLISSSAAFTQNLKSIECIITGLLSKFFLRTRITRRVALAMCLISVGAFLSSVSDVEKNYHGVIFVFVSSIALSCRNVFTKRLYRTHGESGPNLDSAVFFQMSFLAVCFLAPIWVAGIGIWKPSGADPLEICAVGMYHFLYNCLSFIVLSRVSTITHSVCNNVKRVFVVAVSLAYFQTLNTSPINIFGLILCSGGVLYYAHASATSNKRQLEPTPNNDIFDSFRIPDVSLRSVLQVQFLTVLISAMLIREGFGKSHLIVKPSPPMLHLPNVVQRPESDGLAKLNLMAKSVNSTGLRIVMYTAAGNNNLGDNIQPRHTFGHFERFGILNNTNIQLWSSSIQACCYTYPDVVHKFTMPPRPTDADIKWMNERFSVLWVSGGGVLGFPHPPLDNNFNEWMDKITFPIVFAGTGSSTGTDTKVFIEAAPLLRKAVHIGVRSPEDAQALVNNGFLDASYMPDPVLADPTYGPLEPGEEREIQTNWNSTRVCWIPREAHVTKIDEVIRPNDIVFGLDGQEGNFKGQFSTIHLFITDSKAFAESVEYCDLVVTMRYHGAILALRRLIPTILLGSVGDARGKQYQLASTLNLKHCHIAMDPITDAAAFRTRFHQIRQACVESFNRNALRQSFREIEAAYESGFVSGLTKAFQALGLENSQVDTKSAQ